MSVMTILLKSFRRISFQAVVLPVVAAMATAPVSAIEVIGEPLNIVEFPSEAAPAAVSTERAVPPDSRTGDESFDG